ncbi:MAG: sulfate permease [Ignavibacteriae bacterium]|nr:sulfate permease [Ignavibacteriota bacterium]
MFRPKLFTVLKEGYSKKAFLSDLTAGTIVGIVSLPLAIAFAIASGVKPEQGLYTAIIAGIIVAVLGGSRVQIAGPTGAFIVIVYGIVQKYGIDGLAAATLISGVILIFMGVARLGTLLKFIPYPLTVGFTSGIALIIFTSQIKDFLGLQINDLPADFMSKWYVYFHNFSAVSFDAIAVSLFSLLIIIFWPRISRKIPGPLVAIIASTVIVQIFNIKVDTIFSKFGAVPSSLPSPRLPSLSWDTITGVFSPAITLALLGSIESLLSAVVSDGMIRSRHRSNMELVAQGIANIFSPIFGGIPATGAIARTATNVKNGGRTPVAGIVQGVILFLIMIFFGKWAALIPIPTLSAILVVVAYNMSEWRSFKKLLKSPRSDVAVMLLTFVLTVVVDLTVAIEVGVVLSAMFFMKRMAEVSQVNAITKDIKEDYEGKEESNETSLKMPDSVEIFEVYGSLFFGAVEQFTESMRVIEKKPKFLILETHNLLSIDASGIRALEDLYQQLKKQKTRFLISGLHKQPLFAIVQAELIDKIGEDNLFGSIEEALGEIEKNKT